jgi:hypothetical protein
MPNHQNQNKQNVNPGVTAIPRLEGSLESLFHHHKPDMLESIQLVGQNQAQSEASSPREALLSVYPTASWDEIYSYWRVWG